MSPSKTQVVTAGSASGKIFCIQCVTDVTFTSVTGLTGDPSGITFPAGFHLYGNFTAVTVATGSVIVNFSHNS